MRRPALVSLLPVLVMLPMLPMLVMCGPNEPSPVAPKSAVVASASVTSIASAMPSASGSASVDPADVPPPAQGTITFTPPHIEEGKLRNGMRVMLVQKHELPIVSIEVVSDRGIDQTAPAVCPFMGAMLLQGTKKHDAIALSEEAERLGAQWWSGCSFDAVSVSAKVLSTKLAGMVSLLAEVVRTPAFDAKEIERERKTRLTALRQQHDSPGAIVWRAIDATLYPSGHPYALPSIGDAASITAIHRDDLIKARAATLTPGTTTIVVAGDVTLEALLPLLDASFGDWNEPTPASKPIAVTPAATSLEPRILVIDRPGAAQSTVDVVRVGVAREIPDWAQIFLTNYVLGGHFASRLNMNLREKHAYTYGAGSRFAMMHGAGPFSASGEIKTEHTAEAIREIFDELGRIGTTEISDDELHEAQQGLVDQLPGRFATDEQALASLATLAIYHLPIDEFATMPARYRATTKADVLRVAREHLRADGMRVVLVGDATKIVPSLQALGLGKVEVRAAAN